MVFDISRFQDTSNPAQAILGGVQAGQDIAAKQFALGQTAQTQKLQQAYLGGDKQALGQLGVVNPDVATKIRENQSAISAQKNEYLARGAFDILNAPPEMRQQLYADFNKRGVQAGYLPPEHLDDTLDDSDIETMNQMVRGGQKFGDLTTTATSDRDFALREKELNAARAERNDARMTAAEERKAALEASRNKPMSPEAELKADLDAGRITQDVYDRSISKKVAPTEKNYKQFQLQAASFADRMAKSEGLLQPFEDANVDLINNTASALGKTPFAGKYLENITLSSDQQLYRNAASEWIRAKLRKESGAAIPDAEMDQEYRTYFPVPGDTNKVIKQKADLRKNNTASMIKQASGAYESQYLGDDSGQVPSATPQNTPIPAGTVLIFDEKGNMVQ